METTSLQGVEETEDFKKYKPNKLDLQNNLINKKVKKIKKQMITAKVQIFPNKQQVIELKQMFELYSLACNWLSKKVFQNKILNQVKLHHLVYDEMRSELGTKA